MARGENDQVSTIRLVDPGEDAGERTPRGHWWAPGRAWDRWRVCGGVRAEAQKGLLRGARRWRVGGEQEAECIKWNVKSTSPFPPHRPVKLFAVRSPLAFPSALLFLASISPFFHLAFPKNAWPILWGGDRGD